MQFDWELLRPDWELSDPQKSLIREIAETFLSSGTGLPDRPKRVELGRQRRSLDELVQFGFISNIMNRYYPTFPSVYFLPPDKRDYCGESTDTVFKAFQSLYKKQGPQEYAVRQLSDEAKLITAGAAGEKRIQVGMLFASYFKKYFSNFMYSQEIPIVSASVAEDILDYESLQQAWREELELRPRPRPSPPPTERPREANKNEATRPTVTLPKESGEHAGIEGRANRAVDLANTGRGQSEPTSASKPEQPRPAAESTPATTRLPDVWMLSDRPIESRFAEQDRFQFKDYAKALAAVLDHEKTETPLTMAINAPWGAGKTTLANMIAEQLKQRPNDRGQAPHIICWFNAWMHDDAQNLGTAFISEVGRTANMHRKWLLRLLNPLPSALLEPGGRKWRRVVLALLILAPTLLLSLWIGSHLERVEQYQKYEATKLAVRQTTKTVVSDSSGKDISSSKSEMQSGSYPISPVPPQPFALDKMDWFLERVESRVVVLGAFFTALAGLLGLLAKLLTSTALGSFVQSPDKAAETGAIQSAEKQLKKLISQATWRGNRFIVFVDDVERCKPPRSVDVLDAVNQLMDHRGVVVVFLGDMSAVAAAAQLKYKDLARILFRALESRRLDPTVARRLSDGFTCKRSYSFSSTFPFLLWARFRSI